MRDKIKYELDASALGLIVLKVLSNGTEQPIKFFESHQEAEEYVQDLREGVDVNM
jgi:hypothetical protein